MSPHPLTRTSNPNDLSNDSSPLIIPPETHHVPPPPPSGGWQLKKEDSDKASEAFNRKSDAVDRGREVSRNQNTELAINRPDGTTRDPLPYLYSDSVPEAEVDLHAERETPT